MIDLTDTPLVAKGQLYAEQVVAGDIVACKWVRKACERHLNDLKRAETGAFPYYFDPKTAERVCRFAQLLPHVKGKWARPDPRTGDLQRLVLEPWQAFTLMNLFGWLKKSNGFRRFNRASLYLPRKNGKALDLDTPIFTPRGWTRMGDLREGDEVFHPSGKPVRVKHVFPVEMDRPCYEVCFSNGERIIADEEHEWFTSAKVRNPGVRVGREMNAPLSDVRTTKKLAQTLTYGRRQDFNHTVALPSALQIPARELPIPPYSFGAWLGDGHSESAYLTLCDTDEEIAENIRAEGMTLREVKPTAGAKLYSFSDGYSGPDKGKFINTLRRIGVFGDKHIPECYLTASLSDRLSLIQGLMDTDGTVSKRGTDVSITSKSETMAQQIGQLLSSMGLKWSLRSKRGEISGRKLDTLYYTVQFAAHRDTHPVFRLRRKLDRLPDTGKTNRSRTVTVTGVNPVESRPVRCISVEAPDGMFLAGRTMLPTHNSFYACVIGWWCFTKDNEPGAEIYCGATTEAQAWEVFRPAKQMAVVEPKLQSSLNVKVFGKAMKKTDDGSRFEPVIGKPGDGASPHCAIVDEYHEHPDSTLYDTMKTGMGAREQPLLLIISTAGDNLAGPCRADWRDCEKLLDGAHEDDQLFTMIWTIDEGMNWATEEALTMANPNWGVSINPDQILPDLYNAVRDPAKQAVFKTKHLNLWVAAKNGWVNMEKWNACADTNLHPDQFKGQPCYVGIDAAAKVDVFSMVQLFERDGTLYAFAKHYMPEETIERPENQHLRNWVAQGHLIATPGARTDQTRVEDQLRDWSHDHSVQEVAYDPKEISYLMEHQVGLWAGFPLVEITQGPNLISQPMKELEALIETGKLRHNGDPVLTWMMSNVIKKEARGGGPTKYYYPAKERPENKIDGVLALLMALSRHMVQQQGAPAVAFF